MKTTFITVRRMALRAASLAILAATFIGPPASAATPGATSPTAPPGATSPTVPRAATAAPIAAGISAEEALARVARQPYDRGPLPKSGAIAEARSALESAAAREPANPRWVYGLAHTTQLEGRLATGAAAAAKRKEAKGLFQKASEADPKNAEYQYWFGNACFDMIDDVGFLSKASLASAGHKGYEKAIELDANYVAAHYALGLFFSKAPAIAGGSPAKAKEQGEALLKLPGGRGEYWGHYLLASIATAGKDWPEMSRQYTSAETAKGEGADPVLAMQAQISTLLTAKKDPAAALPIIQRYRAVAKPDDVAPDYFDGEAHRQLGQCEQAIAAFEKVLAKTPEARNTRFAIADCFEKVGNRAEAKKNYDEFVRRFPTDDRASKAKEASKRLG